jgi:SAM-dependent methyltransferase
MQTTHYANKEIVKVYSKYAASYAAQWQNYWTIDKPFLDFFAAHLPQSASILDVGAGTGNQAAYFSEQGYKVTAVEDSPGMRSAMSRQFPLITVIASDLPELNVGTISFDGALCRHVLHHLSLTDLAESIIRINQALKHGGYFCLIMPVSDTNSVQEDWYTIGGQDAVKQNFYPLLELERIFITNGFTINELTIQTKEKKSNGSSGMPVLHVLLRKAS